MRNISDKVVERIKTHILRWRTFSRKSCCFLDNVGKHGRARQATCDNIVRRTRFAWWITKAADTHSKFVVLTAFALQQQLCTLASILRLHIHCLTCIIIFTIMTIIMRYVGIRNGKSDGTYSYVFGKMPHCWHIFVFSSSTVDATKYLISARACVLVCVARAGWSRRERLRATWRTPFFGRPRALIRVIWKFYFLHNFKYLRDKIYHNLNGKKH
jgi:hypothetical protein